MQVTTHNDIKVYNLTVCRLLPNWLPPATRRRLLKADPTLENSVQLIQDFEMPVVSSRVKLTSDGRYVFLAGTYKPRIRCFDVEEMSLKFERCVDAEIVDVLPLSTDYKKFVLLHSDRHIEVHHQSGRHHRCRTPHVGRALAFSNVTCDLYVASEELYRLNFERGQFLAPFSTSAPATSVQISKDHGLVLAGTETGVVEAWDYRVRERVGVLPISLHDNSSDEVSCLQFQDSLHFGVGLSSGMVKLYDLRATRPFQTKDHNFGFPINSIRFLPECVLSTDSKCLKSWDINTAETITAVQPDSDINQLCYFENSGLMFMATEAPKVLVYFIPTLGPAPKWCGFLENLTEEMEIEDERIVYDNYKFVTRSELQELSLNHLIGTNILRAYMHGFFIDTRLYNKVKVAMDPCAYEDYKKRKIKEKIEEQSKPRIIDSINSVPKVNKEMALRLQQEQTKTRGKKRFEAGNLLSDDRFSRMFVDPEMQINTESEEFKNLNPVLGREISSKIEKQRQIMEEDEDEADDVDDQSIESNETEDSDYSSDDAVKEVPQKTIAKVSEVVSKNLAKVAPVTQFSYLTGGSKSKNATLTLRDRVIQNADQPQLTSAGSNKQITFLVESKKSSRLEALKEHIRERKKLRRGADGKIKKLKGKAVWT